MRNIIQDLLTFFEEYCLRETVGESYRGIKLCDINHDDTDDSAFLKRTKEALDFIAQKDPRRFHRVQNEIRYIVNMEMIFRGGYRHTTRCCSLDYGHWPFEEHPEWYLLLYAGTIVHEATHGALCSKGFKYTKANREQVERICYTEQHRFLTEAKPEWRDYLVGEFDPSRWHFSWNASWWAKTKAVYGRIKESRRRAHEKNGKK